jgi:O-antigen ligase
MIPFLRTWLPYAILILTLALYPLIGIGQVLVGIVNTTPIAVLYRAVYLLLSCVLLITFLPESPRMKVPVVVFSFVLFWLLYVFRIVNDIVILEDTRGYSEKGLFFFLTYGLGGCLAPAIIAAFSAKSINYKTLTKCLLLFFALSNLCIFAFLVLENGLTVDIFYNRLRVGESVVSPIALSQYGGALFVLSLGAWLISGYRSFLLPVAMGVGIVLLILGASRGPLAACAGSVMLILFDHFLLRAKLLQYWAYASVAIVIFVAAVVKFIVPNMAQITIFNRISSTVESGVGLDARELQWSSAWNQFIESPVWGGGLIENAMNFYPHNFILEVLMSTGLLGAIALAPAIVITIWKFLNRRNIALEKRIYLYLFLFFLGCAMFSLSLITNAHLWITWALVASLPITSRPQKEYAQP